MDTGNRPIAVRGDEGGGLDERQWRDQTKNIYAQQCGDGQREEGVGDRK